MINQDIIKAGEVAVNSMTSMSEFEQNSVSLLRHADKLYDADSFAKLPENIRTLFYNRSSRYHISDLINILTTYHLRPIVRHQPNCNCVGADENVFANILKFALSGHTKEAMILGSLLINSCVLMELVQKAAVVAQLVNQNLKNYSFAALKNSTTNLH